MPIVIPTAEEVDKMDARQREQWKRRMGLVKRETARTVAMLGYGDTVMTQARLWQHIYGADPEAARHQAELLEWA